ncbi:MAG: DNA cytosine methyltransferase [Blautia sp.]|nr:DNA cytosine methyltransferase [Blautia sp.]
MKRQTTIQVKILSRSFYAEILALQGFPAGLRASYFIRDKSGYPEFRNNQPFSTAGSRKGFGDPRGTLFFELARLAEARKPEYLLFENVPYALLHIRYIMSCKQLCKASFCK